MEQRADKLEVLMEIARDLTASLAADDRYNRLLNAVTRVIPCDAACLLRLEVTIWFRLPAAAWRKRRWCGDSAGAIIHAWM